MVFERSFLNFNNTNALRFMKKKQPELICCMIYNFMSQLKKKNDIINNFIIFNYTLFFYNLFIERMAVTKSVKRLFVH